MQHLSTFLLIFFGTCIRFINCTLFVCKVAVNKSSLGDIVSGFSLFV